MQTWTRIQSKSNYYGRLIDQKLIERAVKKHYQETHQRPTQEDISLLKMQFNSGQTLAIS